MEFPTRTERLELPGGVEFPFTTATREELLSRTDDVTGLWGWTAGQLLATLLATRPHLARGCAVAELGCGAGLQASVCAHAGAAAVVATDACPAVLPLAGANALAAAVEGRSATAVRSALLRWGDAAHEAAVLGELASFSLPPHPTPPPGRFHLVVASETFYVHRGDDTACIEDQAAALLACALRLLAGGRGGGGGDGAGEVAGAGAGAGGGDGPAAASPPQPPACPWDAAPHADPGTPPPPGAAFSPAASCGLALLVYTPRYRGMGPSLRRGAARAGAALATLHRDAVLTPAQRGSLRFGSTRLAAASGCARCLARFLAAEALPPGGASDDEDRGFDDDGGDPAAALAAVGAGLGEQDDD